MVGLEFKLLGLRAKIKVSFIGFDSVVMVTYCVAKITPGCTLAVVIYNDSSYLRMRFFKIIHD